MTKPTFTHTAKLLAKIGKDSDIARALGVTRSSEGAWKTLGVPAKHCYALENLAKAVGADVTCEQLRPDLPWYRVGPFLYPVLDMSGKLGKVQS